MPSYNSKGGAWEPAKEKAVNLRTGEVYEGPDREAVAEIKKAGGRMGMKADQDPENIMRARQLGISVQEYLNLNAPPTEEQQKAQKEAENKVVDHKPSGEKKRMVRNVSGGVDVHGGFGDPPKI